MRKVGDQATAAQNDGLPGFLSSIRCCGVSRWSAEPVLAEGKALDWNKDSSGWPHGVVWLDYSLGVVVNAGAVSMILMHVATGFIGHCTLTNAGQRVSGTQISMVLYFGVSLEPS